MICSAAPPCSRSALNDNQKGLNQLGAVADPGFPVGGGGADLQHVHFLAKTDVKTKEMDPVGGARRRRPLDPLIGRVQ